MDYTGWAGRLPEPRPPINRRDARCGRSGYNEAGFHPWLLKHFIQARRMCIEHLHRNGKTAVTYTLDRLAGAPIILFQSPPGESISADLEIIAAEMAHLLDEQPEPVFLVLDLHNLTLTLDDMLRGIDLATRGRSPVLLHPRIRENVLVITDPTQLMALKALSTATFGQMSPARFETVEQALDHCRQRASTIEL